MKNHPFPWRVDDGMRKSGEQFSPRILDANGQEIPIEMSEDDVTSGHTGLLVAGFNQLAKERKK